MEEQFYSQLQVKENILVSRQVFITSFIIISYVIYMKQDDIVIPQRHESIQAQVDEAGVMQIMSNEATSITHI